VLWINATYGINTGSPIMQSADNSGFSTNLTNLLDLSAGGAEVAAINHDAWYSLTTSTARRYVRWYAPDVSTTDPHIWSVLTFGNSVQVATAGPQIQTDSRTAAPVGRGPQGRPLTGGTERVTFTFRKITRANADTILRYCALAEVWDRDASAVYQLGVGGGGGTIPIALVNDADNDGDAFNSSSLNEVYYGLASVSTRAWAANYTELIVRMDRIPASRFAT
jgi:hypothetical protein